MANSSIHILIILVINSALHVLALYSIFRKPIRVGKMVLTFSMEAYLKNREKRANANAKANAVRSKHTLRA